ncbi:MAG: ABC transporter permease [Oscillospiraceae bacterium]|jgi:spermidine/putrescine transport system permease protein|nr:ABC transporter permease [Oscillospiraceae bacterium]
MTTMTKQKAAAKPRSAPPRSGYTRVLLNTPYLLWCVIFVLVPLAMVAYYAFTDGSGHFTLGTFADLLATAEKRATLVDVFGRSMFYALIATAISLVLAYPLAYIMAHSGRGAQRNLMMLLMVPMWMNFLICTYCWMNILSKNGIINGGIAWVNLKLSPLGLALPKLDMLNKPGAVILGMVYNYLPYMILPIYTVLAKLSPSLVEAAQDLGASRFQVLRKVTAPLSLPGVASGITMVFVPSVSTFYISQKLGGTKNQLIGDWIERSFMGGYSYNGGAALSLILMLIIVVCMMVMKHFSDGEEGAFVA